ncbi:hypothetical protein PV620_20445, partial [Streptomyces sp. ME02-6978a]|nr:hypothetical protein [Streptomyces sp. ME02-6978a]
MTLVWALAGAPTGTASADACAYVSSGPGGSAVVAAAGEAGAAVGFGTSGRGPGVVASAGDGGAVAAV